MTTTTTWARRERGEKRLAGKKKRKIMRHGCPSSNPHVPPSAPASARVRVRGTYRSIPVAPSKRTRTRARTGDSLPSSIWEQLNIQCARALGAASCVSEYDERHGKREDLSKRRAPKIIPETMTTSASRKSSVWSARERERERDTPIDLPLRNVLMWISIFPRYVFMIVDLFMNCHKQSIDKTSW